jgi:hypothetical protein
MTFRKILWAVRCGYCSEAGSSSPPRLISVIPLLPQLKTYRIRFVPHWQYVYAAKMYQLHVPSGMGSKMFTHLPSRNVFVDEDRDLGEEWLGHWMAHELGHLATNSVREEDAEKAAWDTGSACGQRLRKPKQVVNC